MRAVYPRSNSTSSAPYVAAFVAGFAIAGLAYALLSWLPGPVTSKPVTSKDVSEGLAGPPQATQPGERAAATEPDEELCAFKSRAGFVPPWAQSRQPGAGTSDLPDECLSESSDRIDLLVVRGLDHKLQVEGAEPVSPGIWALPRDGSDPFEVRLGTDASEETTFRIELFRNSRAYHGSILVKVAPHQPPLVVNDVDGEGPRVLDGLDGPDALSERGRDDGAPGRSKAKTGRTATGKAGQQAPPSWKADVTRQDEVARPPEEQDAKVLSRPDAVRRPYPVEPEVDPLPGLGFAPN